MYNTKVLCKKVFTTLLMIFVYNYKIYHTPGPHHCLKYLLLKFLCIKKIQKKSFKLLAFI